MNFTYNDEFLTSSGKCTVGDDFLIKFTSESTLAQFDRIDIG